MSGGDKGSTEKQRIDSWKEIAAFFGRDERTVKRWEQNRSLPVHRVPGSGKSGVFAYAAELREWLHSSSQQSSAELHPESSSDIPPADFASDAGTALRSSEEAGSASVEAAPVNRTEASIAPFASPPMPPSHSGAASLPSSPGLSSSTNSAVPSQPIFSGFNPAAGDPSQAPTSQGLSRQPTPRGALFEMPRSNAAYAIPLPSPGPVQAAEEQVPPRVNRVDPNDQRTRLGSIADRRPSAYRYWVWAAVFLAGAGALVFLAAHRNRSRSGGSSQAAQGSHGTRDQQAEEFYLKGRYYWSRRTADSLKQAVDAFTQAIVRDPADAEAYAGLADTYDLMPEFAGMPRSEAYPRAIAASSKAVALDDSLSEAHRALAFSLFYGNWEIPRALSEYRRAIQLNPGDVEAHHWYATSLMALGRSKEALEELERARQLEPASKSILADRALLLYALGERTRAIVELTEMERSEPEFLSPPNYLSEFYLQQGSDAAYLEQMQKMAAISKDAKQAAFVAAVKAGFARGGRRGMLEEMLGLQKAAFDRGESSGYEVAYTDLLLGDSQDAVPYLHNAAEAHDERLLALAQSPFEAALKADPAYQELKAQIQARIQGGAVDGAKSAAQATEQ